MLTQLRERGGGSSRRSTLTTNESGATLELPSAATIPILAVGGELKNTICVVEGNKATMTPAMGSLADAQNYRRFIRELDRLADGLVGRPPAHGARSVVLAHDLHPTYLSTIAAGKLGSELKSAVCEGVQHHHAHAAACLAEHGIVQPAVGITCDGAGYGTDGAAWGCEVLHVTRADFQRCAQLQYFPLPGGDAAAKQTWRPALGLMYETFAGDLPAHVRGVFDRVPSAEFNAVWTLLGSGFNCPPTSSLGRLFDAVAFLTGVCDLNEFEGQAAMQLQEAAKEEPGEHYSFHLADCDGGAQIIVRDMIADICRDVRDDVDPGAIASRFHATVAKILCEAALAAARAHNVEIVALSGGCFHNQILTDRTVQLLLQGGVRRVLTHERLSPGDASLSLGQAVVAAARLRKKH